MPQVTVPTHRELIQLSPTDRLRKAIEGEAELITHHERRLREARQRQRDYRAELAKLTGGTPIPG